MLSAIARSPNFKWWAFASIAIGTFSNVMDHGSVIVALPSIAEEFDSDLPTVQWVVVGYSLSIAAFLLPMGRLADIVGLKQIYIAGMVVFIIMALIAGFSTNIQTLIAAKLVQGAGSGMMQGTGMAMIISVFPGSERGKALGSNMSLVGAGGIVGPALGGVLVSTLGWQWVFFINVPIGILAIIPPLLILDKKLFLRSEGRPAFDWLGAALSSGTLVTFLVFLTMGPRIGWSNAPIIAAGLSSAGLVSAFIWWELRAAAPMLDLTLFKNRVFSLGACAEYIIFLGGSSTRFLMPFYVQAVLHKPAVIVGLFFIPSAVVMMFMGPLGGRLSDQYGWRKFNIIGMLLSASGVFILSQVTTSFPVYLVILAMMLQTGGMSMFNASNNSSILGTVDRSKYGIVAGWLNLLRNSANITSIAVATAIVTGIMVFEGFPASLSDVDCGESKDHCEAFVKGLRRAYLAMGILLVFGAVVSFLKGAPVREAPAHPAEQPRVEPSHPD